MNVCLLVAQGRTGGGGGGGGGGLAGSSIRGVLECVGRDTGSPGPLRLG